MQLLRELGVRADVALSLANHPVAQVRRVIAQAHARPGVRDKAGWVVSALRALPEHEPEPCDERPPSVTPIHFHPDLSDEERDRWIKRFHAASTPTEKRAVINRLEQEYPNE
jgi:hypothetical protein